MGMFGRESSFRTEVNIFFQVNLNLEAFMDRVDIFKELIEDRKNLQLIRK